MDTKTETRWWKTVLRMCSLCFMLYGGGVTWTLLTLIYLEICFRWLQTFTQWLNINCLTNNVVSIASTCNIKVLLLGVKTRDTMTQYLCSVTYINQNHFSKNFPDNSPEQSFHTFVSKMFPGIRNFSVSLQLHNTPMKCHKWEHKTQQNSGTGTTRYAATSHITVVNRK